MDDIETLSAESSFDTPKDLQVRCSTHSSINSLNLCSASNSPKEYIKSKKLNFNAKSSFSTISQQELNIEEGINHKRKILNFQKVYLTQGL